MYNQASNVSSIDSIISYCEWHPNGAGRVFKTSVGALQGPKWHINMYFGRIKGQNNLVKSISKKMEPKVENLGLSHQKTTKRPCKNMALRFSIDRSSNRGTSPLDYHRKVNSPVVLPQIGFKFPSIYHLPNVHHLKWATLSPPIKNALSAIHYFRHIRREKSFHSTWLLSRNPSISFVYIG